MSVLDYGKQACEARVNALNTIDDAANGYITLAARDFVRCVLSSKPGGIEELMTAALRVVNARAKELAIATDIILRDCDALIAIEKKQNSRLEYLQKRIDIANRKIVQPEVEAKKPTATAAAAKPAIKKKGSKT